VVFLLTTLRAQGGQIICVDHVDLMQTPAEHERHRKLAQNLARTSRPSLILVQFSVPALYKLLEEEIVARDTSAGFDWIYVDVSGGGGRPPHTERMIRSWVRHQVIDSKMTKVCKALSTLTFIQYLTELYFT
jgi:hypothetical protein